MLYCSRPLRFPNAICSIPFSIFFSPCPASSCRSHVLGAPMGRCLSGLLVQTRSAPPPFCPQCGDPAPAIEGLCGLCRTGETRLRLCPIGAPALHRHASRNHPPPEVFRPRIPGEAAGTDLLKECLEREPFTGNLIVPVPLHRSRERERGFNQAELIAARLGSPHCRTRSFAATQEHTEPNRPEPQRAKTQSGRRFRSARSRQRNSDRRRRRLHYRLDHE